MMHESGARTRHVGGLGDSAGGHLSLLLGLMDAREHLKMKK